MPDPLFSEIEFPNEQHQETLSQLVSSLRRKTLTIHNRLTSIQSDADFVTQIARTYGNLDEDARSRSKGSRGRPLVANERCGSWYVRPQDKGGSAYFKSTDGHERAWKFSTRRLNVHLFELIEEHDGIIVVDSTRRGKRMPDALSTTIPIWCTVMNLVLFPSHLLSSNLFLPPHLPASFHAQITALVPSFVASLKALNLKLPTCLTKPLRPFWITQDSIPISTEAAEGGGMRDSSQIYEEYRPVICCTASRRVVGSEMDEGGYIQGAGDDTENWAHGLTPVVFWENAEELLQAAEDDLPELIEKLLGKEKATSQLSSGSTAKQLSAHIAVCPLPLEPSADTVSRTCHVALTSEATARDTWIKSTKLMEVGLGKSKTASRNLRAALPVICDFVATFCDAPQDNSDQSPNNILIACETGKDLSVGTALALDCYLFDEQGRFTAPEEDRSFTKTMIKARLGRIMTVFPEANPSRATLQSVNSFLMDWRK